MRPFIHQRSVRNALASMLYGGESKPFADLEALLLVDLLISETNLPLTDEPRAFAVRHILIETIQREYARHCTSAGLIPVGEQKPADTVTTSLQAALKTRNQELLSWCLLYYRYVRVDLGVLLEMLPKSLAVEERTIRRYLRHAVRRLTDDLVNQEWNARSQQQRLRLKTLLPSVAPISLIGRDADFEQLHAVIQSSSPRHVQIIGAVGIGKTVFVQEFVRRQIEQGEVEQLVWIENPPTPLAVAQTLHERLALQISLREYTLENRLTVVLDAVEWSQTAPVDTLLNDLSGAVIYVTSREYLTNLATFKNLTLSELDENQVTRLVTATVGQNVDNPEDYSLQVYHLLGGNPLAVKLAAQHLMHYDLVDVETNILNRLFEQVYGSLSEEARRAWVALTLLPPGVVLVKDVIAIWPQSIGTDMIFALLRQQIGAFDPAIRACTLTTAARHYIQKQYERSEEIAALCRDMIEKLDHSDQAFAVIEHILSGEWPPLDLARRHAWIERIMSEGLRRGHYTLWLTIIERFMLQVEIINVDWHITRAVCLRHLAQWQQAEALLIAIVRETGAQGQFEQQGRALLELGILARLRGQYKQAEKNYERAYIFALRQPHSPLHEAVQIERAQLAVDSENGQLAESLLQDVPQTARVLALLAEARLLVKDSFGTLNYVQQALALNSDHTRLRGRLNILLGRLYEQQDDYDSAEHFFALAITLMEQYDDFAGLARARANLGSIFIHQHRYLEARNLLIQAESALVWLDDRAALLAVRHNLNILRRGIAG